MASLPCRTAAPHGVLPGSFCCSPSAGLRHPFAPRRRRRRPATYSAMGRLSRLQCAAGGDARVHFRTQRGVAYGEVHKIVGGHPSLGDWDVEAAPAMRWSDGDVWSLDVSVPAGAGLEFKCVKVSDGGGVEWECGGNRSVQGAADARVSFQWGDEGSLRVEAPQPPGSGSGNGAARDRRHHEEPPPPETTAGDDDDRLPHQRWQGRATRFMRANEHGRERAGVWDTRGLAGAAAALVAGDERAGSWLEKMQLVKRVLVEPGRAPGLDKLAHGFIYLQLIATGAIECVEGGGHYRPNKHAELARDIFSALERLLGEPGTGREVALLARRAHTRLPSFDAEFTAATPLTRIRDIAHRSDIPHDLKQEIKHTIQNKLHRNAGPEDLVATEEMLARITAPGADLSPDFVGEFSAFTRELRDFFNAGSLADLLAALRPSLEDANVLDAFLEAKARVDTPAASGQACVDALHALTSVRALLLAGLRGGPRNDASDDALAMRQRWRLAEIRCEEYAFVLLSRFASTVSDLRTDASWALPLGAAVLGVRQLGLGGWEPAECLALENELGAWQQAGGFSEPARALRLKASLERLQRLTQGYADALLAIFPERAAALGAALGLDRQRVDVFTEAEIRASVVFQLSKLVTLLLKAARAATGGSSGAWDALVAGEATGRLVEVSSLAPGVLSDGDGPVILLVKAASGDEEVGAAGANLRGVVLAHSLPHLSHLGVRARQERVTFATCEDEGALDADVRPLLGSFVLLSVSAEGVTLEAAEAVSSGNGAPSRTPPPAARPAKIERVESVSVLPLERATTAGCGAKAAACAELARVADGASLFRVPPGVCLPLGCMEAAVREAGKQEEFTRLLSQTETAPLEELDALCERLQALVAGAKPPPAVMREACDSFPGSATLIARSSANVEDLAGMSGAGLYESLAGVPGGDPDALASAVAGVWASLYARRAVLSRRAAGVAQADAAMAVLVQQQLAPRLSFVLHTRSPLGQDPDVLVAELAAGLGETLASGTRGSPWRLVVTKSSGAVATLAFANFSAALHASDEGGGGYRSAVLDYAKQPLSVDDGAREAVGARLAAVGAALEDAFGGPQDVEGALVGDEVYVVQTRPQP